MKEAILGLWVGEELSLMEQLSIKSFLAHGHPYHLYVYQNVRNVPEGVILKDANEILPQKRIFKYRHGFGRGTYSGFANLFRLKLLNEVSGIWADLDVVCLKPFDFQAPYVFSSERIRTGGSKIHNGIIKVPVGCSFIKCCYERAEILKPETLFHGQNGEKILESVIKEYCFEKYMVNPNIFCPLDFWDLDLLLTQNDKICIPHESFAVHLWNENWRRGLKKELFENRSPKQSIRIQLLEYARYIAEIVHSPPYPKFINQILGIMVPNKNMIYDPKTLYGKLQEKYL